MELLLIIIAGISPIILGIYTLHQKSKKEAETAKIQEKLIEKQEEIHLLSKEHSTALKEKTDKIVSLQNELNERQKEQITTLKRLALPIPKVANITFSAHILVSEIEFDEFMAEIDRSGINTGNLLPAGITSSTSIGKKISQFEDIHIRLIMKIKNKEGKTISFIKNSTAQLMGFNAQNRLDIYILSYKKENNRFNRPIFKNGDRF